MSEMELVVTALWVFKKKITALILYIITFELLGVTYC